MSEQNYTTDTSDSDITGFPPSQNILPPEEQNQTSSSPSKIVTSDSGSISVESSWALVGKVGMILAIIIPIIGFFFWLSVSVISISNDTGDIKDQLDTIENVHKDDTKEIKSEIKDINKNINEVNKSINSLTVKTEIAIQKKEK